MHRPTYIYICCDPSTKDPRYVGKTVLPVDKRIKEHQRRKGSSHRERWFHKIGCPDYFVAETVPPHGDWAEAEQFWIAYLRSFGAKLVNSTRGGEGTLGYKFTPLQLARVCQANKASRTEEVRAKISASNKGRVSYPRTQEWRDKVSAALKGRVISAEHREKISRTTKGRPATYTMAETTKEKIRAKAIARATPEYRAMLSNKLKGRVISAESIAKSRLTWTSKRPEVIAAYCQKLSDAAMGHPVTEETRAKISAAHKGRVHTAESRKNMSDAHKGKTATDETRARMSSAQRAATKRTDIVIEWRGESKTLCQWAVQAGFPRNVLYKRVRMFGWDMEDAMTRPMRSRQSVALS